MLWLPIGEFFIADPDVFFAPPPARSTSEPGRPCLKRSATGAQVSARLTTASITALIDCLEQRGFVRRGPRSRDGRKVIVEITPEVISTFAPYFASPELSQTCCLALHERSA
jgi:hypothetical protein